VARAFKLAVELKACAFAVAKNFHGVIPSIVALTSVDGPLGKDFLKQRVSLAIGYVLFWAFHGDPICPIVADTATAT
jgi:hypothetical protein